VPETDTAIEWTDSTWNPVHGCFAVSRACADGAGCYAWEYSNKMGHTDEDWTVAHAEENVRLQEHHLDFPRELEDPQRVFVNSMSDLFLPEDLLSDEYVHQILDVVEDHPEHAFIALTKHGCETGGRHPDEPRMLTWDREHGRWPDNLWMGVTVETNARHYRIDQLREIGASTTWVSFEPLLEPIGMPDLQGIDWAVVGGQSGDDDDVRIDMAHEWVWPIREACERDDVAFYFKQSSGRRQGYAPALRCPDGAVRAFRELPELPGPLRDARPDLAAEEVTA